MGKKILSKTREAAWRKKCKEYAAFLMDDYDFDYGYILLLLRYKLQRTRLSCEKGYSADKATVAAQIKVVEDLLLKVDNDDYYEEAVKSFHKKYGKPKMVTKPYTDNTHLLQFIYKNGKEATPAMNKQLRALHDKAFENRKADLKKAFDLMVENIWSWWD